MAPTSVPALDGRFYNKTEPTDLDWQTWLERAEDRYKYAESKNGFGDAQNVNNLNDYGFEDLVVSDDVVGHEDAARRGDAVLALSSSSVSGVKRRCSVKQAVSVDVELSGQEGSAAPQTPKRGRSRVDLEPGTPEELLRSGTSPVVGASARGVGSRVLL